MNPGQKAYIFKDPITRNVLEGEAELVRCLRSREPFAQGTANYTLEDWLVRFDKDSPPVERVIRVDFKPEDIDKVAADQAERIAKPRLDRTLAIAKTKLDVTGASIAGLLGDLRIQLDQIVDMRQKGEAINPEYAASFAGRAMRLVAIVEARNQLQDVVERSQR